MTTEQDVSSPPGPGWSYACDACGLGHGAGHCDYCRGCGGPVLASASPGALAARRGVALAGPGPGLWRYADHLPLAGDQAWLSLGEGTTPLVAAPALADRVGAGEVWLKLDQLNPTGSFKDRAAAAAVAHAVAGGARGVVCASSGNAAASAAAYAARAGLPAVVVVPAGVPVNKLVAALVHGALALSVPGDYSRSFALARELCAEYALVNLATTYVNPHGVAALRSVAFELYEKVGRPDWVHVPTSAGPLVHGVAEGYRDLVGLGLVDRPPRVVAAQPAGCAPVAAAYAAGLPTVDAWPEVTTTVSGINDPLRGYAGDGTRTLGELRDTGGRALALPDDDIVAARRLLAEEVGVFVEPAAAASVASLLAMAGAYDRADVVVALLTGHGLKTAVGAAAEVPLVGDLAEARTALARGGLDLERTAHD